MEEKSLFDVISDLNDNIMLLHKAILGLIKEVKRLEKERRCCDVSRK